MILILLSLLTSSCDTIEPMPSVSGRRVFVLGDSLSSGRSSPGAVFASLLAESGAQVQVNAKVGRSANGFIRLEDGEATLARVRDGFDPDIVYVVLGTNDLGLNLEVDARQFERIRSAFPRASVWGVGPPAFADRTLASQAAAMSTMMASVFPAFIDLRPPRRVVADLRTGCTSPPPEVASSACGSQPRRCDARACSRRSCSPRPLLARGGGRRIGEEGPRARRNPIARRQGADVGPARNL